MDDDLDPPISNTIANGWANFAETVLPSIGGARAPRRRGHRESRVRLAAREKDLRSRVNAAALAKNAEMLAAERRAFEKQLVDKSAQVATPRKEQLQLRREREPQR